MNSSKTIALHFTLLFLAACSEWPPNEQEFREHFLENQRSFEALRQKLIDSKYVSVHTTIGGTVYAEYFDGDPLSGEFAQSESPPDKVEWLSLIESAGAKSVHRHFHLSAYTDQVVVALPLVSERVYWRTHGNTKNGSEWQAAYFHGVDVRSQVRECQPKHVRSLCGSCVTSLENHWWIRYWWMPNDLTPAATEAWLNGGMHEDEYDEISNKAIDQCFVDGGTLLE